MALDRWGPRRVYAAILMFAVIPNTVFALSSSMTTLVFSRLALSVVGAGFVVGIRMVSEWFPPKEVGTAEGVYGGWGNFGAAAAAFSLPMVAGLFGGDDGWRWSIFLTGVIAAGYGLFYLRAVTDTPEGVSYVRPRRQGALEVTNRKAVFGLAALTVPLNAALALIAWRIWRVDVINTPVFVRRSRHGGRPVDLPGGRHRAGEPAGAGQLVQGVRSVPVPLGGRAVAGVLRHVRLRAGRGLDAAELLRRHVGPRAERRRLRRLRVRLRQPGARPTGGMLSDLLGSRRRTLIFVMVGVLVGYVLLATMGAAWPWALAVVACMVCSCFVQAGAGAVFAIVPLVKKRVSGQVAGMAGAYGNIGGVAFLTIGLFVGSQVFFLSIAVGAALALVASFFLVEPAASFAAELLTDEQRRRCG